MASLRFHSRMSLSSLPLAASKRLAIFAPRYASTQSGVASADKAPAKPSKGDKPAAKRSSPKTPKKPPRPAKLVPPKRAMNIMQLVTQSVMSELKEKNGGKLSQEDAKLAFKLAAEKYRSLTEADKKNYRAELDRRREIYEIEMREFLDSLTPNDYINQNQYIRLRKAEGRSIGRKGIPKLDPNAPKRPLNGFMIFCGELRSDPSKFPELAELIRSNGKDHNSLLIEGSKVLANHWRTMPDDVKQSYLAEAQKRGDQYKKEKAEYDARATSSTPQ